MKICCKCKKEKHEEDFCKNKSTVDGLQKYCRTCKQEIAKKWYNSLDKVSHKIAHIKNVKKNNLINKTLARSFVWDYLKQHPCIDCGEADPVVLEFDHVVGEKRLAVCTMVGRSYKLNLIQKEIDKCEVRCCNCHRRKTAKQFCTYRHSRSTTE